MSDTAQSIDGSEPSTLHSTTSLRVFPIVSTDTNYDRSRVTITIKENLVFPPVYTHQESENDYSFIVRSSDIKLLNVFKEYFSTFSDQMCELNNMFLPHDREGDDAYITRMRSELPKCLRNGGAPVVIDIITGLICDMSMVYFIGVNDINSNPIEYFYRDCEYREDREFRDFLVSMMNGYISICSQSKIQPMSNSRLFHMIHDHLLDTVDMDNLFYTVNMDGRSENEKIINIDRIPMIFRGLYIKAQKKTETDE